MLRGLYEVHLLEVVQQQLLRHATNARSAICTTELTFVKRQLNKTIIQTDETKGQAGTEAPSEAFACRWMRSFHCNHV